MSQNSLSNRIEVVLHDSETPPPYARIIKCQKCGCLMPSKIQHTALLKLRNLNPKPERWAKLLDLKLDCSCPPSHVPTLCTSPEQPINLDWYDQHCK